MLVSSKLLSIVSNYKWKYSTVNGIQKGMLFSDLFNSSTQILVQIRSIRLSSSTQNYIRSEYRGLFRISSDRRHPRHQLISSFGPVSSLSWKYIHFTVYRRTRRIVNYDDALRIILRGIRHTYLLLYQHRKYWNGLIFCTKRY